MQRWPEMPRAGEAVARWEEIERALIEDKPLPEEARRYLLHVAQRITLVAEDGRLPPARAANAMLKVLALTGSDLAAFRASVRDQWVDHLFEHWPGPKVETVAEEVAEIIGKKSGRTAFRRRKRSRS